jgi:hypothetical protein
LLLFCLEVFVFLSAVKHRSYRIYKTIIFPMVLDGCQSLSLTLKEEDHRLSVSENRVLRIFGLNRDEVTGERKLHNEQLHKLHSLPV